MYYGAVHVSKQSGNPDAIAQASHSLRELMEKLARLLDVPMAQTQGLASRVSEMADKYRALQEAEQQAQGQEEKRHAEFYESAVALATWFPDRHTPISKWGAKVIDRLDPRQLTLPTPVKEQQVKTWNKCHKCFEGASHHGSVTIEAFQEQLQLLEDFLRDQLRPGAVEDQQRLKDIVQEGESHA